VSGVRIVVADDFATLRRIVRNTLRTLGSDEVVETADGLQALEACTSETRLLVTGWSLRGMNGIQLVRKLRENPETAGIRVMMLSRRRNLAAIEEAREAGVNDYLLKPVRPDLLIRRLSLLLADDPVGPEETAQAA
jgi:two-component system chemotaxis response regulator CheY